MASERSHRPRLRKELGQHHLRRGRSCAPLIDFLEPASARVLEVGPGGGVLTRELLAVGAEVVAWEIDPSWAFEASRTLAGAGLRLVVGDALELPWQRLPAPTLVAGNLPYGIATALIRRLLPHGDRVPRAAFLVQHEVALRLAASAGDPDYGYLGAWTAAWAEVSLLGRVPPGSFVPPPRVDSAFVGLRLRRPPLPPPAMARLERLLRSAFAHRRKTLVNCLAPVWGRADVREIVKALEWPAAVRAEELAIEDFVSLLERLDALH